MLCCQPVRPSSNIKKDDQPQYIPHIRKMLQHVMDDAKDGSMLLRGFCMPKVGPGTRATRKAYEVPDSGGALVYFRRLAAGHCAAPTRFPARSPGGRRRSPRAGHARCWYGCMRASHGSNRATVLTQCIQMSTPLYLLGDLIRLTDPEHLRPFVVQLAGPLIRIVNDRFTWEVKAAIIETLGCLP